MENQNQTPASTRRRRLGMCWNTKSKALMLSSASNSDLTQTPCEIFKKLSFKSPLTPNTINCSKSTNLNSTPVGAACAQSPQISSTGKILRNRMSLGSGRTYTNLPKKRLTFSAASSNAVKPNKENQGSSMEILPIFGDDFDEDFNVPQESQIEIEPHKKLYSNECDMDKLQLEIERKEAEVAAMNKDREEVERIKQLIDTWRNGCKNILGALQMIQTDQSEQLQPTAILQRYNIPESLIYPKN